MALGTRMAMAKNDDENNIIRSIAPDDVWIPRSDVDVEGTCGRIGRIWIEIGHFGENRSQIIGKAVRIAYNYISGTTNVTIPTVQVKRYMFAEALK